MIPKLKVIAVRYRLTYLHQKDNIMIMQDLRTCCINNRQMYGYILVIEDLRFHKNDLEKSKIHNLIAQFWGWLSVKSFNVVIKHFVLTKQENLNFSRTFKLKLKCSRQTAVVLLCKVVRIFFYQQLKNYKQMGSLL